MASLDLNFDSKYDIIDSRTPRHQFLSGRYKRSFAYYTLRERLPVILTGILDSLAQDKDELIEKHGEHCREEIKNIIGHISKLKYQLQTDKPFRGFQRAEPDKEAWNNFIKTLPDTKASFFKACWLHSECYMYRQISSFFEASETLKQHDYFAKQKQAGFTGNVEVMDTVAQLTRKTEKNPDMFMKLLKLDLWGNSCDLSFSNGKDVTASSNPFEQITALNDFLLCDHSRHIWQCLIGADQSKPVIVDFILDNAGYELFTDFILAEYIIDKQLASKIRFHVKAIPWFVSDVTSNDFHWTLQALQQQSSTQLCELGKKWTQYLQSGKFQLEPIDYFWTGPFEFFKMRDVHPKLYERLGESRLVIFKGDLNYRKLLGDYNWDDNEQLITCLRGFEPTHVCALRTCKSDLICGLHEGLASEVAKAHGVNWLISGKFAVIQYSEMQTCGCKADDDDDD